MAKKGFIDAVKDMHAKMEEIKVPSRPAPVQQRGGSPTDTINVIKRFPQLLFTKTGK